MHLPDTILLDNARGLACVAAGGLVSLGGLYLGGRRLDAEETGRAGMMAAFVFAASSVHVSLPLVGIPVHLGLYGLAGVILGRRVLLIAPIVFGLQALLLGEGGLAATGLNAANMSAGAFLGRLWYQAIQSRGGTVLGAFGAGFLGVAGMAALTLVELLFIGYPILVSAAVPLWLCTAALEGMVTAVVLRSLLRLYPELLSPRPSLPVAPPEVAASGKPASPRGRVLFFAACCLVHGVEYSVETMPDGRIRIGIFYEGGSPMTDAAVVVLDRQGSRLAEGRTNREGFFFFRPSGPGLYRFTADDGAGHRVEELFVLHPFQLDGRVHDLIAGGAESSWWDTFLRLPRWLRLLVGLCIVWAFFATLAWHRARRKLRSYGGSP